MNPSSATPRRTGRPNGRGRSRATVKQTDMLEMMDNQLVVTANYPISEGEMVDSRTSVPDEEATYDRLGGAISSPSALNINQGDLIFVPKGNGSAYSALGNGTGIAAMTSRKSCFAVFNGLQIPLGTSKEAVGRTLKNGVTLAGVAYSDYAFADPSQTKGGLSVLIIGDYGHVNDGRDVIQTGDELRYRINYDEADPFGQVSRVIKATIEVYTPESVNDLISRAVEQIAAYATYPSVTSLEITNLSSNYDDDTLGMLRKLRADTWTALSYILTAEQRGLITINTPPSDRPFESDMYQNLMTADQKHPIEVNKLGYRSENGRLLNDVSLENPDVRKQRIANIQYLAGVLGLSNEGKYRADSLVRTSFLRANFGHLVNSEARSTYNILGLITPANAAASSRGTSSNDIIQFNGGITGLVDSLQSSSSRGYGSAISHMYHSSRGQIIGFSSNAAVQGAMTNFVKN